MSNEIPQENKDTESLPLPKDWSASVRNAVLNVIGIVRIAMLAGREALIEHADLTAVLISGGFWTNWMPNAICQRWPVCWWVLNVVDHYSRRCMGFAEFKVRPTSEEVTTALMRIMFAERIRPKHLIVDQGPEFDCHHFRDVWCKAMKILPRFGAVGKHGSIVVVERFHRTIKEILRQITIPEDQPPFERELRLIVDWYNEQRPHDTLGGRTPNEVYFSRPAANEQPRFEPRQHWPRGSPCAKPQAPLHSRLRNTRWSFFFA